MAHINITYQMLELLFKHSLQGQHIIRVKKHPFLARTLMAEFYWDPEEEAPVIPLIDEVIETTLKKE